MHTEANLAVEPRSVLGSLEARRLRRKGRVPANLYGHKQPAATVHCSEDDLLNIVRHKIRIVNVDLQGKVDKCMLQEVQWDSLGNYINHIDLLRIDPNEQVTVEVPVELKGTAPGAARGILENPLHSLTIRCLAYMVPDAIAVRIGHLEVDQMIHVSDIEVPEGTSILNAPDAIVVRISSVNTSKLQTEALEGAPTQPEVIGKKPTAEEGADAAKAQAGGKGKK